MSTKGGKFPASQQPQAVKQLRMQSSAWGNAIPLVYGESRVAGNIVMAFFFRAIPHRPPGIARGGKMGGRVAQVQYTYQVSAIFALGEGAFFDPAEIPNIGLARPGAQVVSTEMQGPNAGQASIQSITGTEPGVWKLKRVRRVAPMRSDQVDHFRNTHWSPMKDAAGNLILGPSGEFLYVSQIGSEMARCFSTSDSKQKNERQRYITDFGEEYPGIGCAAIEEMELGGNASIPNWNFPYRGLQIYAQIHGGDPADLRDSLPPDIFRDLLINSKHGAGFNQPLLQAVIPDWFTSVSSWGKYCAANNILISPIYDQQTPLSDMVKDIAALTNTAVVWSEGVIKMVPYGDLPCGPSDLTLFSYAPFTDSAQYTTGANIGVQYDLTVDDFLPGKDKDPVQVERTSIVKGQGTQGFFNHVRVEFYNRANGYTTEVAEAKDEASIAQWGLISEDPHTFHGITNATLATETAIRILQRLLTVRAVFRFTLGPQFCLLDPMDVVTLTEPSIGLDHFPVRITTITEDKSGTLAIEAEEFPHDFGGATPPPLEPPQTTPPGVTVIAGWGTSDLSGAGNPFYLDLNGSVVSDDNNSTIQNAVTSPIAEGGLITSIAMEGTLSDFGEFLDDNSNNALVTTILQLEVNGTVLDGPGDPKFVFTIHVTMANIHVESPTGAWSDQDGLIMSWEGEVLVPDNSNARWVGTHYLPDGTPYPYGGPLQAPPTMDLVWTILMEDEG